MVKFPCACLNPKKVATKSLTEWKQLLEHAELCLIHLFQYAQTKQQNYVDELTGLYNSRYLPIALQAAVDSYRKTKKSFTVLFVDLDHFKKVNDSNGHRVGSELLSALGKTLKNALRGEDEIFRYGGDEFVIILHHITLTNAKKIAERLREKIEKRLFLIQNKKLKVTASIGLASFPEHAKNTKELLELADTAMYSAKKTTRNAVREIQKEAEIPGCQTPPLLDKH